MTTSLNSSNFTLRILTKTSMLKKSNVNWIYTLAGITSKKMYFKSSTGNPITEQFLNISRILKELSRKRNNMSYYVWGLQNTNNEQINTDSHRMRFNSKPSIWFPPETCYYETNSSYHKSSLVFGRYLGSWQGVMCRSHIN